MKKRKGKFLLKEALEFLDETTYSAGYPDDGTGVSSDDDMPPGNIVYGEKYKKGKYFNKLTPYDKIWKPDNSDWTWDKFKNSIGMEDFNNYSNTLNGMERLFPEDTWRRIWSKMKNVPNNLVTLRFKKAGQPWRKGGKDQIGNDKEDHVEINTKKYAFKDSNVTDKTIKESVLTDKIDVFMI